MGWEIVSTGGTAEALRREAIPVLPIEHVTGFPEMMDGRVKTLHPKVHGGLLGRRDNTHDLAAMKQHGVPILPGSDGVIASEDEAREWGRQVGYPVIIKASAGGGGRGMRIVRAEEELAALDKRYQGVVASAVMRAVFPKDAARRAFLKSVGASTALAALSQLFPLKTATKVFAHTAAYDAAILAYLSRSQEALPAQLSLVLERQQLLRYGENPHQRAALYTTGEPGVRELQQLHGKELSFNNLLDMDAAVMAVAPWSGGKDARAACVIIKHTTPCGIALGRNAADAYQRALVTDRTSAFGSVIAFNTVVDRAAAEAMRELFVEVVVAPRVDAAALEVFQQKRNLRVVELPRAGDDPTVDFKRVRGGFLAQDRFRFSSVADESKWQIATARRPADAEWNDLRFAWAAVGSVKSNAIVLAREEAAIGIGAGQMSRVDASFLAVHKARQQGHDPKGAVLASDAFFPFRDGVDEAAKAGITAIIQLGGSVNDNEVKAAADQHGLAMVLTGMRQFRH